MVGRSSKQSAIQVEATKKKPLKKGKREAEDDVDIQLNQNPKKQKKELIPQKVDTDSSSSDSSDSDVENKELVDAKKQPETIEKAKEESSSSSEDEDDDSSDEDDSLDEEIAPAKKQPEAEEALKKEAKAESSSSEDEDESSSDEEDEELVPKKEEPAIIAKKDSKESSSSGEDEESEDEKKKPVDAAAKEPVDSTSSEKESSSSSDEESDEEEKPPLKKAKVSSTENKTLEQKSTSDESSEESSDEESEDEQVTPKKIEDEKATPKKQVHEQKSNVKQPKTPCTGSKTLFAGNLSFRIDISDVENFFKEAGEMVDFRLAKEEDGRLKGYGHIEFASAEAAQKALKLNGKPLLGREIRLDFAQEKSFNTPRKSNSNGNNHGKGSESRTIVVKRLNSSSGVDEVKKSLRDHFGTCGEVGRIYVPTDRETGAIRGYAFVDLKNGYEKALEQSGSEIGGCRIVVEADKPKGDAADGNSSRWSRERDNNRGRRGTGRINSNVRGRFNNTKPNLIASAQGKKTVFNDDDE